MSGSWGPNGWGYRYLRAGGVRLGLETLDDEPDRQHQLEEHARDREQGADVDPEDFCDAPHYENRVADQARNRQEPGDQPGPEHQRAEEYGPDSERYLADVVGHGVRLDRERPEGFSPTHARRP